MRIKKMIKEKCISALIVTCMVLGLMQTEWGIVNVKAASKSVSSEGDFGSVVSYTFSKQTTAEKTFDVISVTAGEYILTRDVTISHPLYIANGVEVTIILDGYTLSRGLTDKAATNDGLVIVCEGDLTLGSENNREGVITGGNCNGMSLPGGIYVGMKQKSSHLINYVTISGNSGASGGGIYAYSNEGEVLVENYGYITNNTTSASGGGIYASNRYGGSVELYNYGYIERNAAASSGGGLYVWADNGTIYFENNKNIDNNTAETQGGGVYITGSECTFYNKGSIIGNKTEGSLGGGVRINSATFKNSGKIKNNIAKNGAGVYSNASSSNTGVWLLDGTEITGNEATKYGGAITNDGNLYMSGKVIVNGNYGNTASSRKSDNIRLIRNKQFYINGALSDGSNIAVNVSSDTTSSSSYYTSVISSGYGQYVSENELKYFTLDSVHNVKHIMFVNSSGEVEIGTHTHSWSYANGDTSNTIKAYCTAQLPSCEYYGTSIADANNYLTLTLNASSIEYSGNLYNGASTQWDTTGVNSVGYTIYYKGIQGTEYSESTSRPTEAGTYIATVTLGSAVATAEFDINKINQSSDLEITMSDYVYNQSEALPTPSINGTVNGGATVKYYYNTSNSTDGGAEWKDIDSTSLPIGTYYMYAVIEATNNYNENVTETVPFDVHAANMTGITVENVDVTYDGEYHGIEITGVPQGATIKYGTSEGTYTLDECPTYKDASTEAYVIYYQVTATGYNTYTGSATIKISPAIVNIIWGDTTFAYDGQPHLPEANVTGVMTGDSNPITIIGEETEVGTGYEAEAVSTNSNYKVNEAHKNVTFEITKGVQNAPQIEGVDETILGVEDGKIIGLTTNMEYRLEGETEYVPVTSEDMIFAPGKYYVRYSETANYNSSTDMVVVIEEGPENTPPVVKGIEDGKTYCHDVEFSVEDNNIDKIYIDGREITLTNGKYTISVEDIMANPGAADSETHVVRIVETTQEVTEFTITVTATHEYEEPEFSWSEDNSSVTVTSKCVHDDKHVVTVTEETDVEIVQQATETVDGKVEYTVTVVIGGARYTKKKVVEKSINDEIFSNVEASKGNESNKDDEGSKGNESNKDDENSKDNGASKDNQSSTGNGNGSVPGLGDANAGVRFVMYALIMAMIVCVGMLKFCRKEVE